VDYNSRMKLVNVSDYGIKSINYYWARKEQFNLSLDELNSVGIAGDETLVDAQIIPGLLRANEAFRKLGFEMIIKDGYRSAELYDLVRKKRYEIDGKENTDKTFSTGSMPHSSGFVVDVNLISLEDHKEVEMWDKKDWPEGIFMDFYRDKDDSKSIEYQRLQDLLVNNMQKVGFCLGKRREFHHFEYKK